MAAADESNLQPWNPWGELEEVEREIDRQLEAALAKLRHVVPGREIAFVPKLDVVETAAEYRLYLALPGLVEEDIDITLEGRVLIVRGERESPYDARQGEAHVRQWKYGYFERRVELPSDLSSEAIQADYDAGVLTIRVPKVS